MPQYLTTGGARDPFLPRLLAAIRRGNQIDLAVAFIKSSGLALLFNALTDAVETRGARLRVLTSDYLDVTDPQALRRLMLLAERGADMRVFETGGQSFHLKAYICVHGDGEREVWGAAFVGSSNISRNALTDGLEWNYRIDQASDPADPATGRFREIRDEFQFLFDHSSVRPLDHDWIEAYEHRRQVQRLPVVPGSEDPEELAPWPTEVQREALSALAASRIAGYRRGLVVMATGLGKTFLAAFDSEQIQAGRVLFVAHREEILLQAEASFQRVRPRARVGRYTGSRKDAGVDLLFASIQTLGQGSHLSLFDADIREDLRDLDGIEPGKWLAYWRGNPINAWTGGNRTADAKRWFEVRDGRFQPTFRVTDDERDAFQGMVQELIDYRLAAYEPRLKKIEPAVPTEPVERSAEVVAFRKRPAATGEYDEVPYFPDLKIACGHFLSGRAETDGSCRVGPGLGRLDPARHFVARAIGNSMNGGKQPVKDGDYLLLESIDPTKAGSITGSTLVIERQGAGGEDQYLLRVVQKSPDGRYILKATNPDYPDYEADDGMRILARLRAVLAPEDFTVKTS